MKANTVLNVIQVRGTRCEEGRRAHIARTILLAVLTTVSLCFAGCRSSITTGDGWGSGSWDNTYTLAVAVASPGGRAYWNKTEKDVTIRIVKGTPSQYSILFLDRYTLVASDLRWHTTWTGESVTIDFYDWGDDVANYGNGQHLTKSNHVATLAFAQDTSTGDFREIPGPHTHIALSAMGCRSAPLGDIGRVESSIKAIALSAIREKYPAIDTSRLTNCEIYITSGQGPEDTTAVLVTYDLPEGKTESHEGNMTTVKTRTVQVMMSRTGKVRQVYESERGYSYNSPTVQPVESRR